VEDKKTLLIENANREYQKKMQTENTEGNELVCYFILPFSQY
jgi:hypothetical protein